jgi:hypothetical protein
MPDKKKHEIVTRQRADIAREAARDSSAAAIGALVGVALGGVPGAIVGATVSPVLIGTVRIAADVLSRRRQRAEAIVEGALLRHSLTEAETLQKLADHPQKADDFVSLLSQAIASDPSIDAVISAALGEILVSRDETQRERILIVTDSIRGLRPTHMRVLRALHSAGGTMSASAIAEEVHIPQVELRGVVRGLELRGMLKDLGKHPVEWKIRELGRAIMAFDHNKTLEKL